MKTALVTGAAKRIGKAIAERLLDEGFKLIVHAHTSIDELKGWIDTHPKRSQIIHIVSADLAIEDGQNTLVSEIKDCIAALDLLVHNASAFSPLAFSKIGRDSYQSMMGVNLDAPFFITQGLLSILKKSSRPSVINILDAMWERPSPQFSHYAVSKAGLAILTRALANELAPKIRVNAVAPGSILFQPFHTAETRKRVIERIPYKRLGNPSDIAEAVIYLSERALYTTGEILVIDGGRSIFP